MSHSHHLMFWPCTNPMTRNDMVFDLAVILEGKASIGKKSKKVHTFKFPLTFNLFLTNKIMEINLTFFLSIIL
jgi:hypothetical protein